jgi:oligopeptide/dipeptide ABC transporter ATP-binding protein
MTAEPLLRVFDLTLEFISENQQVPRSVLQGVSFDVFPHEVMGLVGESGSGKTMTALSIMRLLPPAAKIVGGEIFFGESNLLKLSAREMRAIRGDEIAMIFQNPRAALNPLMRVGDQVARAVSLHHEMSKRGAYEEAIHLLVRVGIPDAASRARAYPHQLSGGMAQRVLIAIMLACRPTLLIADEPTTGLDVTIQAQIFELIKDIRAETQASLLLITHDLGVVSEVCQRVAVMYAGQIMEVAPVHELFAQPRHPYTERLLSSILRVDMPSELDTSKAMAFTSIDYENPGCRFANRCPYAFDPCWDHRPHPLQISAGQMVVCHKVSQELQ